MISILQALERKWRTHKDVWGISAKRNCREESNGTVRKMRQEQKQHHNERLKRAFNELISRLNTASRRIQGNMKTGYCLDYIEFLCYISLSFSSDLYYLFFFFKLTFGFHLFFLFFFFCLKVEAEFIEWKTFFCISNLLLFLILLVWAFVL